MKVFEFFPAPSMRNGFMQTVSAWTDVALVEFGSEGTMHYAQRSIHGDTSNLFTSAMREKDIIFGDTDTLEQAVREVDKTVNPKVIFVTSSPVSEVIGTDLSLICRMIQPEVNARLCPLDTVPTESTASMGKRKAFEMISNILDEFGCDADKKSGALVLGLTDADYNGKADMAEIRRMFSDYFGINTLNKTDCCYSISDLSKAEIIVTVAPESNILANKANELYGTPVINAMPYGMKETERFVSAASNTLGKDPSDNWKNDKFELKRAITHFKEGLHSDKRRRVYLDIHKERINSLRQFINVELGLRVITPTEDSHSISTDGLIEPNPVIENDDVIAASGVMIRLYPKNRSICISEPTAGQKMFGEHMPYMGTRGAMSLMTLLHPAVW